MRKHNTAPSIRSSFVPSSSNMNRAEIRQSTIMIQPVARHSTNEVRTEAAMRSLSRAPRCRATRTLTALPIPMRKPVNNDTRIVVEPTAPNASALENLPTTATSAILKSTCKSWDSISGMLKKSIFFHREPSVIRISPCALLTPENRFAIGSPPKTFYAFAAVVHRDGHS